MPLGKLSFLPNVISQNEAQNIKSNNKLRNNAFHAFHGSLGFELDKIQSVDR